MYITASLCEVPIGLFMYKQLSSSVIIQKIDVSWGLNLKSDSAINIVTIGSQNNMSLAAMGYKWSSEARRVSAIGKNKKVLKSFENLFVKRKARAQNTV